MSDKISQAAQRLRQAVTSGAYDDVEAAIADYRKNVDAEMSDAQPHERLPHDVAREADELFQWALQVVRAARSQGQDQCDRFFAIQRYRHPDKQVRTWKVDG